MSMVERLPDETFAAIVEQLSSSKSLCRLECTSRNLHAKVDAHGWRAHLRTQFPWYKITTNCKDAVRDLTSVSRNWDRKALIARYLEPHWHIQDGKAAAKVQTWQRPTGQTMGFRPVIASQEVSVGSKWSDVRQTLAYSAGTELVIRTWEPGNASHTPAQTKQRSPVDAKWSSYRMPNAREGRDDITTLHLLDTATCADVDTEHAIVGFANGDLLELQLERSQKSGASIAARDIRSRYVTSGKSVQSTTITSTSEYKLLAAHLSHGEIRLFPLNTDSQHVQPISKVNVLAETEKTCSVWSTTFLSSERLAVGLGPSIQPLRVYEVRPDGIGSSPLRSFEATDEMGLPTKTSIYPIIPMPCRNSSTSRADVFLSGGFANVRSVNEPRCRLCSPTDTYRLHDMRSPRDVERSFEDPTDDSTTYSLLCRGEHHILAGSAQYGVVKVFDTRMTRPSEYIQSTEVKCASPFEDSRSDWKIFLNSRGVARKSRQPPGLARWGDRSAAGSVYTLASPSPWSPLVYAGLEGAVVEIDFQSAVESTNTSRGQETSWPHAPPSRFDELNLTMYNLETAPGQKMQSWVQRSISEACTTKTRSDDLDERWVSKL